MLNKFKNMHLRVKFVATFFLLFLIAILTVGYIGFTKTNESIRELAISKDNNLLLDIANNMNISLKTIPKDLDFLVSSHAFNKYLLWKHVGEKNLAYDKRKEAIATFLSFSESKQYFYKVRYIDLLGDEKIVIKHNSNKKSSFAVGKDSLQNKKTRQYFKVPTSFNKKRLYISDVDLNREYGEIMTPYLPIIRFSIAVIGKDGSKHGIFVLSLYASYFLDRIRRFEDILKKESRDIYLIDNNGFYLFNKDKNKLWGKDLGHNISLKNEKPKLYKFIQKNEQGIYEDKDNLYSYKKIYPSQIDKKNYWILYTVTDKSVAFKKLNDYKIKAFSIIVVVLILVLFLINQFITKITQLLLAISQHFKILSLGQVPKERIVYHSKDEFGDLLESMQLLSDNHTKTIKQVKSIADGDLTRTLTLLSEKDELGIAINGMTQHLKEDSKARKYNIWLSEGLSKLSQKLSAEMSFSDLANESIAYICRYVGAGKGVFYILETNEEEKSCLNLSGSYMHTQRDTLGASYQLGEGSIGQVAKEKKSILLTKVDDSINLALDDLAVKNSYTLPILYENELYAVIELMFLKKVDQNAQDFLERSQVIIASILFSVLQRAKVNELLDNAHKTQERLQQQNFEIEKANSEMAEQQQQLEHANSEMAEQQQQLEHANSEMAEQQQQLEHANSEMEEQQQQLEEVNTQMEEQQQQLKSNTKDLEQQNQALQQSKKALNEKANDLELSSKYKSEFLANMSHELRTPLNSIILLSDMLSENKQKNFSKEDIKKATIIHESGNELLRLINDVLDLSKVESGKMELIIENFNSQELVNHLITQFEHVAKQKQLVFTAEDNYQGEINGDKDKLLQILRNFISNALKFTKQGGIKLSITQIKPDNIQLSISDTGIGIAKDKQKTIFEAFQQADGSTSREYGGTGLGLSICTEMARLMGGNIKLESEEGKGSRFSLIFPQKQITTNSYPAEEVLLSEKNSPSIQLPDNENQKQQIMKDDDRGVITVMDKPFLIIEDDKNFALILKENINNKGYFALIALNGMDGLALAQEYDIKGVMLDLGLPDMNGIDVLTEFKTQRNLKNIPVYVISGKDKSILTQQKGAIGFATKPISQNKIAHVIQYIDEFSNKKNKDLLIVEKDTKQRETLIEHIGNDSVKICGVASVKEAIRELDQQIYDTVIIGLELSDGSGYDICEHIKIKQINIPIIIYTGKELSEEENTKLQAYTHSIIVKKAPSEESLLEDVDLFLHRVKLASQQNLGMGKNTNTVTLEGKKILVVDDDIRNIYVLTELLSSKGAEVITANDGKEAVEIVSKNFDIDLILMDLMMPVMNGYEATQAIKENDKSKHIPIIAVTAKAMKADKQKALEVGCSDFISKPLKSDILVAVMKGWLNKNSY